MKRNNFTLSDSDRELLTKLTSAQRQILEIQGAHQQIAQTLGLAIGTVKSRQFRARRALERLRDEKIRNNPALPE